MKKCPYCAEKIQDEALVCPHCKRELYERKGWGKIVFGILLLLCSPVIVLVSTVFFQAYGVAFAPAIVIIIGGFFIGSGIISLVQTGKPRGKESTNTVISEIRKPISKPIKILGLTVLALIGLLLLASLIFK